MRKNVATNCPVGKCPPRQVRFQSETIYTGVDAKRIDVAGHLWGDTVTPLLQVRLHAQCTFFSHPQTQVGHNTLTGPTTSLFDIAICSECIWCHDQVK
jgi:hypothetical protein